ncbi:MAG: DUF192 domain-containing protein [Candidatus Woesearchaeota archaeon]|nr:MAG: DUF192 domain-containing protein [Candidatus Woesearchaeota archaeon]
MKIFTLAEPVVFKNMFAQAWGLRLQRPKNAVFPLKQPKKILISMNFVFHQLDAYFLDSANRIIEQTTLRPFHTYQAKLPATTLVETPAGQLPAKIGDKITWQ